ncbi:MAG TPA: hypothetical protein VGH72_33910 [Pseudonocardia sp.]|jgi:hypothetical protein
MTIDRLYVWLVQTGANAREVVVVAASATQAKTIAAPELGDEHLITTNLAACEAGTYLQPGIILAGRSPYAIND